MRNVAVILAGGVGTRMGGTMPKQFFKVSGKTVLEILSDWNYGNSLTTEQNRIKKIFWGDIPMQNSCKVLTRYIINNGSSNNVDL